MPYKTIADPTPQTTGNISLPEACTAELSLSVSGVSFYTQTIEATTGNSPFFANFGPFHWPDECEQVDVSVVTTEGVTFTGSLSVVDQTALSSIWFRYDEEPLNIRIAALKNEFKNNSTPLADEDKPANRIVECPSKDEDGLMSALRELSQYRVESEGDYTVVAKTDREKTVHHHLKYSYSVSDDTYVQKPVVKTLYENSYPMVYADAARGGHYKALSVISEKDIGALSESAREHIGEHAPDGLWFEVWDEMVCAPNIYLSQAGAPTSARVAITHYLGKYFSAQILAYTNAGGLGPVTDTTLVVDRCTPNHRIQFVVTDGAKNITVRH
jgi:hypothetical protein